MNCITLLTKESEIFSEVSAKVIVYMYLISTAKVERGGLYSELSIEDIQNRFRFISESEVDEAIAELLEEELIARKKAKIQVGTVSEGVKKLFIGIKTDVESFYKHVYKYADDFMRSTKSSTRNNMARKLKSELEAFEEMSPAKMNGKDFVILFRVCYEIVCQDYHREFMAKDFGQMKNFTRLYDNVTVVQMILYYCAYYEKWGKAPTIASLVYNKDEIYKEIKGKAIKKSIKREDDESGF